MKKMVLAAAGALTLGLSAAAFAQGVHPGAEELQYGTQAFSGHCNHPVAHFLGKGTVFAKIFGHAESGHPAADTTANRSAISANGG
jgi:hypothetical protein